MKKPIPKRRAHQEILHYVLSFCISKIYGADEAGKEWPRTHGGTSGFVSEGKDTPVQIGDLVLLSSVGASKWQIGWLVETREINAGWPEYLVESLEDGSLCWWSNVGIAFLQRSCVQPEWRWSDRQFAFKSRWWRVCYKDKAAYIVRPLFPEFGDGFEVTLGTRTSHGFDDIRPSRSFPDWRKVTKAMMAAAYDECVAERERIREERKAAGDDVDRRPSGVAIEMLPGGAAMIVTTPPATPAPLP
jgi:hypothetical protein